jgi:hypothetical protein
MDVVRRYRKYAADCLQAARQLSDPKTRGSLIDMAQVWKSLAEHTENNAPQQDPPKQE